MISSIYRVVSNQRGGAVTSVDLVSLVAALAIYLVLTTLLGQYIWNNILTKYVTIVKPINKWYEFWLLVVLFQLLIPAGVTLSHA